MILEFIVIQRSFVVAPAMELGTMIVLLLCMAYVGGYHFMKRLTSGQTRDLNIRFDHFFNWFSFSTLHLVHSLVAILYTLQ